MKNSVILMLVGMCFIFGGLLAAKYWVFNGWFLAIPIGGLAIFIPGTMQFIKNLQNEKD